MRGSIFIPINLLSIIFVQECNEKRAYYVDATTQALQKVPFADDLLNHSKFLNFPLKLCSTYSNLLQFAPTELDRLQEEFIDY